jgi:hypothetical protein
MPSKSTPFTPSSILFRPRLWWSRRVLPPGPIGLLRRPFIAIAGLRRHPKYRSQRLTNKEGVGQRHRSEGVAKSISFSPARRPAPILDSGRQQRRSDRAGVAAARVATVATRGATCLWALARAGNFLPDASRIRHPRPRVPISFGLLGLTGSRLASRRRKQLSGLPVAVLGSHGGLC